LQYKGARKLTAVDVAGGEELNIADLLGLTLYVEPLLDLPILASNPGAVRVALAMGKHEYSLAFLPAVLGSEPTRRLGQKHHAEEENNGRNHLKCPRNAERGGGTADELAGVGDVEHDHDSPGDGPLLRAHQATTLGRRRQFRDVDRDLGRADSDAEAVDDATNDEHGDVLRGGHDNAADYPDDGAEHDGFLAAEGVGDVTRAERGEPGSTRHGGSDSALNIRARAVAFTRALIKVTAVVFGGNAELMLATASIDCVGGKLT